MHPRPKAVLVCSALMIGISLLMPGLAQAQVETALGERLSAALSSGGTGLYLAFAVAFVAGLATSLTPCVYPLIPITISLFGARGDDITRTRALGLASCYVGGIATMYTGLGVFFGLTGKAFGSFMASPYVIVPIALFFLAMAASMFGAFELGLPSELQARLSQVGGKGPVGAYLMGLVAGIIAAPCTGPPLAVLLAFVSTQRSVVIGGGLLFTYALGIGVLFFLIAGFALKLPRSGTWMDAVKSVFGVVMVVAALYFLRNVLPPLRRYGGDSTAFVLAHLGIAALAVALGAIHLSFHDGLAQGLRKGAAAAALCFGLYGALAWVLHTPEPAEQAWIAEEGAGVARAQKEHRPLLIDFSASWCAPCKVLEKTFAEPQVAKELSRFVLIKIDCSSPDEATQALMDRYGANTLPTVIIKDSAGKDALTLHEPAAADRLLSALKKIP